MNVKERDYSCPAATTLREYTLGKLSEAETHTIQQHVASCDVCDAAITAMNSETMQTVDSVQEPSAKSKESDELDLTGQLLRQYQIVEPVGRGGMGTVYRAVHQRLQREVAIKVLPPSRFQDQVSIDRFHREMQAVGQLQHANIATAYDADEIDGIHFLAMELVNGPNLSQLVRRVGQLSVTDACALVEMSAQALQAAHQKQLVHRDIKPSNLLLNDDGQVKLLDLGLALLGQDLGGAEKELTQTGQIMGTVDYMAPEQAANTHSVDIKADIYSLGCTLYFLLSGEAPYKSSANTVQKLMSHASAPIPDVAQIRGDIPPELAAILKKMLAKDPAQRLGPPSEVSRLLQPFAAQANTHALWQQFKDLQSGLKRATDFADFSTGAAVTEVKTEPKETPDITATAYSLVPDAEAKKETKPKTGLIAAGAVAIAAIIGGVLFFANRNAKPSISTADSKKPDTSVPVTPQVEPNGKPIVPDESPITKPQDEPPPVVDPPDPPMPVFDGSSENPYFVSAGGTGSHTTIMAAIEQAEKDQASASKISHIQIEAGRYDESLEVACNLVLTRSSRDVDGDVVIENQNAPPLTIVDAVSRVTVRNLTLIGRATEGAEFNAIDQSVGGNLVLESCNVLSQTYNCIKLKEGGTLTVKDCNFGRCDAVKHLLDDAFKDTLHSAIGTKDHDTVVVEGCDFYAGGIQVHGGQGKIADCSFLGSTGVEVFSTAALPVTIDGCNFRGNTQFGINVARRGTVTAQRCKFENCVQGVWVSMVEDGEVSVPGTIYINSCTWTGCGRAVHVQGGTLTMKQRCIIDGGTASKTNTGIQIDSGPTKPIEIADCEIKNVASAVTIGKGQLNCEYLTVTNCQKGLVFGTGQVVGNVTGTKITGGDYGIIAMGPRSKTETTVVQVNLDSVTLTQQAKFCCAVDGSSHVHSAGESTFEPADGGQVSLPPGIIQEKP